MQNSGFSFGIWQGMPIIIFLLAWLVGGYLLVREKKRLGKFGLILILIGGGMNIWERAKNGFVTDNLNFLGLVYNNMADYLIVVGLIVYGYSSFVRRQGDSRN